MKKSRLVVAVFSIYCSLYIPSALADLVINITESAGNVEAAYSGFLDLGNPDDTSILRDSNTGFDGFHPSVGAISFTSGRTDWFTVVNVSGSNGSRLVSWAEYGVGGFGAWDTSSGDSLALYGDPSLGLPTGYRSGDNISGSATKIGESLLSLGMIPGTYVSTISIPQSDPMAAIQPINTITVNVISEVPLPATVWLFGSGLLGLIGTMRRKEKT